ncbi:MAG TPA: sortase [Acidimicrobiia bacterium]|nr:sortase [Acidimicrobiia bacterium]
MDTRAILRRAGWGLIWAALLLFTFLAYQLFVTDLLNSRVQAEAKADLEVDLEERRVELPEPETITVEDTVPEEEPEAPTTTLPPITFIPEAAGEQGSTLGRMVIPSLDLDEVIFSGVNSETLKKGPGHMPGTPVPGQPGNAVISGHRTTYGRPFYDLDLLEKGDRITVETATGLHVYEVRRTLIVPPDDVKVIQPLVGAWLTLTTCHPHFSAAERLIIQAELVEGPNLEYANLLVARDVEHEENT